MYIGTGKSVLGIDAIMELLGDTHGGKSAGKTIMAMDTESNLSDKAKRIAGIKTVSQVFDEGTVIRWENFVREFAGDPYSEKRSVLESSPLGQNLHELLEQSKHPLTDTALEYIKELEAKLETYNKDVAGLEQEINDLYKKNKRLHSENQDLKANSWKRRR